MRCLVEDQGAGLLRHALQARLARCRLGRQETLEDEAIRGQASGRECRD